MIQRKMFRNLVFFVVVVLSRKTNEIKFIVFHYRKVYSGIVVAFDARVSRTNCKHNARRQLSVTIITRCSIVPTPPWSRAQPTGIVGLASTTWTYYSQIYRLFRGLYFILSPTRLTRSLDARDSGICVAPFLIRSGPIYKSHINYVFTYTL